MKLKQAVVVLEEWEVLCEHNDDGTDPDSHELLLALTTVLPILRRAEEPNEPLTLNELRKRRKSQDAIYVCNIDGRPMFPGGSKYCAAVLDEIPSFGADGYHLQAIYGRGLTLAEGDYKKTWLAYRRKPGGADDGKK